MALLEVEDLAVKIGGTPAVQGVSFELDSSSRTGLIGESGCGKSLTALALMGRLPYGAAAAGHVTLGGRQLLGLSDPLVRHASTRTSCPAASGSASSSRSPCPVTRRC